MRRGIHKARLREVDPAVLTEDDYDDILDLDIVDVPKRVDALVDARVVALRGSATARADRHRAGHRNRSRTRKVALNIAAGLSVVGVIYGIDTALSSPNAATLLARARQHFDKKHLSLPSGAVELVLTPIEKTITIPTVANLPREIADAPSWNVWSNSGVFNGDNGNIVNGSIRHLIDLAVDYNDGFDGLRAGDCANYYSGVDFPLSVPNGAVLKVLDTNPYVPNDLQVKASSGDLDVCNATKSNINNTGLNGIYVQFEYPGVADKAAA